MAAVETTNKYLDESSHFVFRIEILILLLSTVKHTGLQKSAQKPVAVVSIVVIVVVIGL